MSHISCCRYIFVYFFFKQKTAYELRISDWSSDVCSSDLMISEGLLRMGRTDAVREYVEWYAPYQFDDGMVPCCVDDRGSDPVPENDSHGELIFNIAELYRHRSEEHTSELQSLMRISYAVFCLKKKKNQTTTMRNL